MAYDAQTSSFDGERDEEYILAGAIELDDGFFTTEIPEENKGEKLKRGRGRQKCW